MVPIFVLLIAVSGESMASLVPQAILQLVQSKYGERSVLIEVFYTSKKVKILDETLKRLSFVKQLKVTPINIKEIVLMKQPTLEECFFEHQIICHQSYSNDAIFLFDTLDNYRIWKKRFEEFEFYVGRSNLNHLVYCEDAIQKDIESFIMNETYESFLLKQNGQVSLHAMTMYTEEQCRQEHLVEINQFSSLERKWMTDKFFRPRIENFHGCTLWIEFDGTEIPFLRVLKDENGYDTAEGALTDLLDALSTHLNFTYLYGHEADKYFKESGQRH